MILAYLIKSGLCLAVLLGFYKLALENNPLHRFKRFYLLGSLVFALTMPLITLTYTSDTIVAPTIEPTQQVFITQTQEIVVPEQTFVDYLPTLALVIYALGFVLFATRFTINLVRLKRKITSAEQLKQSTYTLALLKQTVVPHSFFKYIFLSRKPYKNHQIPKEVIAHEATHVRQKHSLDILFIEFLQVVFWFNPLFWMAKTTIKLNHEFLADQGVLQQENNIEKYQNILFGYAKGIDHPLLESAINYSLTKKRILMMSQTFSRKRTTISALLLIPIVGLCALLFNNEIIEEPQQSTAIYLENSSDKIYARSIELEIVDNNYYQVEGRKIPKDALLITLNSFHTDLTKAQRDRVINLHITTKNKVPFQELQSIQHIVAQYGYHRIVTPFQEIVRAKGNDPVKWYAQKTDPNNIQYAKEYLAGAQRNDKKGIVINIEGSSVHVNGEKSSVKTFRNDIDAGTKDWEETDYTEAIPSILVKNPSKGFIEKLNKEFLKTHFSKANSGIDLLPPPPPAPPTAENFPPPPPPPSVEDHLFKMNRLGGVFMYEGNEVSYKKAQKLVKNNPELNVKTPFPYSSPPRTLLTKEIGSEKTTQNPATKKQIEEYSKWAKMHNLNPNGIIKRKTLEKMYDIYNRMTLEQRKNAEPYPALPPPPTSTKYKVVPGKKVIKGKNDGDKNNPPPPPPPKKSNFIRTSFNKEVYQPLKHTPGKVLSSESEDNYYTSDTYNKFRWDDLIIFEDGRELTTREAAQKMASNEYFLDKDGLIEGTKKNRVVLRKKSWLVEKGQDDANKNNAPPLPKKVIKGKNDGDKNNPPPPPPPKKPNGEQQIAQLPKPNRINILDHLRMMNRHDATFVFKGEQISFKEAMKLARKDRSLDVTSVIDDEHNKTTAHLKEKGWKAVFDDEYKLFRQEKVTITYKDNLINEAEAKKLIFAKPKKVDINILSKTKKEISVALVDVK